MTNRTITNYYKWLSLVTLIVSVVGMITLVEGTVTEKFGIGLLVNFQFHLAFQFLSKVPFGIYKLVVENDSPRKRALVHKVLKFSSLFIMIAPLVPFVGMLNSVIKNHEYDQLIVTMTFIAIFLGGYSLNLKLREN